MGGTYEIVRGSNPQTQGENAVRRPAQYKKGMLEIRLDGSSSDTDAIEEAVDSALNMKSSHFIMFSSDDGFITGLIAWCCLMFAAFFIAKFEDIV